MSSRVQWLKHDILDELIEAFIAATGKMPRETTVLELQLWSATRAIEEAGSLRPDVANRLTVWAVLFVLREELGAEVDFRTVAGWADEARLAVAEWAFLRLQQPDLVQPPPMPRALREAIDALTPEPPSAEMEMAALGAS
jgi:hypothetical protein